jgi:glycosyltransferase involved in cell wall biosynthesis
MSPTKVVVVTPVKNEDWIIRPFLNACSEFADHIVIGDHFSKDSSAQIAAAFPKVSLIQAASTTFSEQDRRNQLLEEARSFGDGNLIISLDADEFFSENIRASNFIEVLKAHKPGTHFKFPFFNVASNLESGWVTVTDSIAFIDDGSRHENSDFIHFPRLPKSPSATEVFFPNILVLHLQYVDNARMESKHTWYKLWERINFPQKSAIEIFRRYNHMHAVKRSAMIRAQSAWLENLLRVGIDLREISKPRNQYWWDFEVQKMLAEHPENFFRYVVQNQPRFPRGLSAKAFFLYVRSTQSIMSLGTYNPVRLALRMLDRFLGRVWI